MTPEYMGQAAAELSKRQLQELLVLIRSLEGDNDPIKQLSADERSAFVSRIATVFPDIERVLLYAFREQLEDIGMKAENMEQNFGGRGGLNMADVLLGRFRDYRDEHLQAIADQRDKEQTQTGTVVPSVDEGR